MTRGKKKSIKHEDITPESTERVEKNLSFKLLTRSYIAIIVGFAFLLPMIHIKNQIYYYSRDISVLWSEYSILMEEKRDLRQKVETIRFKRQVLDTLDIK